MTTRRDPCLDAFNRLVAFRCAVCPWARGASSDSCLRVSLILTLLGARGGLTKHVAGNHHPICVFDSKNRRPCHVRVPAARRALL